MVIYKKLCFLGLYLAIFNAAFSQTSAKETSVRNYVTVNSGLNHIYLNFDLFSSTKNINIYKYNPSGPIWSAYKTLNANAIKDTIKNQTKGTAEEYLIQRHFYNANNNVIQYNFGPIYTGIEIPEVTYNGRILLLIDKKINDSLKTELGLVMRDISADCWQTDSAIIPSNFTPPQVKSIVSKWRNAAGANAKAIFIIGHVAVPYSGLMNKSSNSSYPADGHEPDHNGCWPADAYYGAMNESFTDDQTETGASRTENKNNPSDGKFDQLEISTLVNLQVGRVDLSNLPTFGKTEIQLTRQYFNKLKNFKRNLINISNVALIDDRLGYFNGEAPARAAWMSLTPMFSPNNITEGNYFATLKNNSYLFAQEFSTGGYTQYINVGTVDDYKDSIRSVFNSSFGSYFGDWDNSNNILRGCLASPGYTLTNCWNARPAWYFHHMALGKNIGYSFLETINNKNIFQESIEKYPAYTGMTGRFHISLMGDPTLRLHPRKMVSNVIVNAATDKKSATITWTSSGDPFVQGYNIYRAHQWNGKFDLIKSRNTTTTYIDNAPLQGLNIYMVRPVYLESTPSGTYFNQALGAFATVDNLIGLHTNSLLNRNVKVYPNPAKNQLTVVMDREWGNITELQIVNQTGQKINAVNFVNNQLDLSAFSNGCYMLQIKTDKGIKANAKFAIMH